MNQVNAGNFIYLRVMYEQYFCNVSDYTDQELFSMHFKIAEALLKDEDTDYSELDALYDLSIWQPFEEVAPQYIFDNIVEGFKRLSNLEDK